MNAATACPNCAGRGWVCAPMDPDDRAPYRRTVCPACKGSKEMNPFAALQRITNLLCNREAGDD